ncbi:putative annexin [Helianthus anomalus]
MKPLHGTKVAIKEIVTGKLNKKLEERVGCDTSAVINILAHRDASQRALIENEYKIMYSEELTKKLSSELSGNVKSYFGSLILLEGDAIILKDALTTDIDLKAATEVICSRTPSQIQHLKQLYHTLFGSYLEHAIQTQTSGDLGQLLLAYLSTPRSHGFEVDRTMVDHYAKALFKAGEKRLGTDEKSSEPFSVEEVELIWPLLVLRIIICTGTH